MANNLLITYDLNKSGKNYDGVFDAIKSLGSWAKYQKSAWFVSTNYSVTQARDHIWKQMDSDDSLMVVYAKNNSAAWFGLTNETSEFISKNWNQ